MSIRVVEELQSNYEQLKREQQWTLSKQLAYVLARGFVGSTYPFSGELYQETKQRLKSKLNLFNNFTSPVRESIICLLMTHNQTSDQALDELLYDYEQIVNGGFRRSQYTYFAAYLLQFTPTNQKVATIERGKEIYEAIRERHPFLTGQEDAPIALSLAQNSQLQPFSVDAISDCMEQFYVGMNRIGFAKGDELQFAAGTAVQLFQGYNESIIQEMAQIIEDFRDARLPFRRETYASIVFLTFLSTQKSLNFQRLLDLFDEISETCQLGFYKNLRTSLAVSLFIGEELKEFSQEEIESLSLNMNFLIIQQEISAMIATTAVVAASSSNN
ncbi:hypothetical protein BAU15_14800 [Enterococcus sp. JM4C]|uniref:DUF4003 family protein n=1 Tax=Candidatus Enterococcus huntleyi TaxID=1857217 RepID=UPI00137B6725|nr:DUF4003 family protein [Enterococcus sp. JM4C]KAF1296608.1 hypothetical protein BAU15_14800 [Enterococcus sp. JM4C]